MSLFALFKTTETSRNQCLNKRFRTLETFWNATFMPDLNAKEGNWDRFLFGPNDLLHEELNGKECALKGVVLMKRPHWKVFRKRFETVQIWTSLLQKSVQAFQSEALFDKAFQIVFLRCRFELKRVISK